MPSKYLLCRNLLAKFCLWNCLEKVRAALTPQHKRDMKNSEGLFGYWLCCSFMNRLGSAVLCAVVLTLRNTCPKIDACKVSGGGGLLSVPKTGVKPENQEWAFSHFWFTAAQPEGHNPGPPSLGARTRTAHTPHSHLERAAPRFFSAFLELLPFLLYVFVPIRAEWHSPSLVWLRTIF